MDLDFDQSELLYYGSAFALAAATYYMFKQSSHSELDPLYNFEQQSIEIDENEHTRTSASMKNRKDLMEYRFNDVRTLNDVLRKGMEISANGPCLGHRVNGKGPYVWLSYSEVIDKTKYIGSGLINQGVEPVNTTNIGIYSKNRPEWTIAEYACYAYSLNVISLYDSYGKDSIKYILNQAEISTVFVDTFNRLSILCKTIDELPYLRLIVYIEELNDEQIKSLNMPSRVQLISWNKLTDIGRNELKDPVPPKPSDSATICYTSGTTGNPKGAILTHANLVACEAGIHDRTHTPHLNSIISGADRLTPRPVAISFLPLAHILERMNAIKVLLEGAAIGYISGDITTLMDDCQELKPTNIPMVPRLLNKLYDKVHADVSSSKLKKYLLKKAIESKEADRQRGIIRRNTIYDRLIFNKIRNRFGGNLLRAFTASAPLTTDVMKFCRAAFSCAFPEAYGQTESASAVTFTHNFDPTIGHVGAPLASCLIKLVDVPQMEYYAANGCGEVCVKGPQVFKGYYKEPEKTAETIDKDGWLHTGDIGMWLPNGCLKIVDRIKHIFKLSNGEYISPERVENVYSKSLFIAQILVEGTNLADFIVAIIVPDKDYLISYCKQNGIEGSFSELCKNKEVRNLILTGLNTLAAQSDLMSYEKIKNIYVHDELFTPENNLATPTLKLKRVQLRQMFKDELQNIYDEIALKK